MSLENNISVIIPAAGNSSRFGGSIPKQFLNLGDETVIEKSVNLFLRSLKIREVIVAINANDNHIKSQSFYNDSRVEVFVPMANCFRVMKKPRLIKSFS